MNGRVLGLCLAVLAVAGCKKEEASKPAEAPAANAPANAPTAAGGSDALAKAAQEPGAQKIKTTARDGQSYELVFQELQAGSGASPKATDTVKVNYRGTLTNGQEFDASAKHGGPISFPLNGVIPCWTEGVQHLKVGGKAKLTCPPELAYGSRGAGGVIPPNATLVFEVELVGIGG